MAKGTDWRGRKAPALAEFEELAASAWTRLPEHFRSRCGDIVIRIEEFATDEVLDELGIESPFDLMGLYTGVSLDRKSVMDLPRGPDACDAALCARHVGGGAVHLFEVDR